MTPLRFSFQAMASPCESVIGGVSFERAAHAARLVEQEVKRIEAKYSRFTPDGILGQINALAYHEPVALDQDTQALMDYADRLYRLSDGLFDITTGTLQTVWDFKAGVIPERSALDARLAHVGWHHVQRQNGQLRLADDQVRLDLGGFGKEYAADRAAAVLRAEGIESGYVDLGGDICVVGPKSDGRPWSIGIRHPRKAKQLIASLDVPLGAVATSGDYERYFMHQGRRYCHILSPKTGMPVSHWQSVSVMAPMASLAGATCTIAMLKEADGLDFLHQSGFSFLAIDAEGQTHTHNRET
jgi:thiamine biosynthesis lipoprotein